MSGLLSHLLRRIPIGWLQLRHNKGRLAAALAGVAFANLLVFVQLGILGALHTTITHTYTLLDADIMISAIDANTVTEGSNVPRRRMFQALGVPGVADAAALYLSTLSWTRESYDNTTFQVMALDPTKADFLNQELAAKTDPLRIADVAIIDRTTRGIPRGELAGITPRSPLEIETNGRTLRIIDTFAGGSGFTADGYMITSDQTFLRIFPGRVAGAPNHILLKVSRDADPAVVVSRLREFLGSDQLRIRTLADAAGDDKRYLTTQRPTGLIFGFGVVMGILVGIVIVYQVLSTDVADHLSEYATFKAVGYGQSFFISIVFEEALILAVIGFLPGFMLSWLVYGLLHSITSLPVHMAASRAVLVFLGTLAACSVSGAIATRRLAGADPADLFK